MPFKGASTIVQAEKDKLKQYLLGQLPEADEEQVEVSLLTKPDYAEEFDILANEITDQYTAREFEGEELERVEKYFFKSTERRNKLRFALALNERKKLPLKEPKKGGPGGGKSPFTSYLAIAASIVLVAGASFGVWRVFFYQPDLNKGLVALRLAFSKERPLEARLSDFNYAPLPNQRGGPSKVDYLQRDIAFSLLPKEVSENPSAPSHHALGQYYLAEHKFDQAIDQFNKALGLDPNNAKIHSDLGAALLEQGKIQSSGPDKGKELETFARSLGHFNRALELYNSLLEAHFNRALVSQHMMPSQQAQAAWREYLQRDASSPWADEARRNLKLLEENGRRTSWNTSDALRNFLDAQRTGDDNAAWNVLSQAYTSAGNEVTNSLLNSLFDLDPAGGSTEPGATLQALLYLAGLESDKSGDRYTSDLVRQYERAAPKLRRLVTSARQHLNTGYALFTQSKFSDAIGEYAGAKLAYEQAGDTISGTFVDYRLAHCYVLLPDLEKAEVAFRRVLATSEIHGYRWLVAQCLYGLAHVSAARNEYSKSVDYSGRALAVFEQAGDLNGVLKCMAQLADLHQSMNRIGRSLSYLSRGLAMTGEIRAEPMQRWGIFVQIAYSMSSMQLPAAALLYHKEALGVALEMGRPLIISRSHGYVGSAYAMLKMYPEAVSEVTKAFETGRSISETGGLEIMANASLQLGDIRRQSSECDKAIEAYDRSMQLYDSLNLGYYSYASHKGKLLCLISGSDERAVRAELRTVLDLSELFRSKITAASERISFFEMEQSVFDLAIRYEFTSMNDPVRAFEYSERSHARALLDGVRRGAKVQRKSFGPDLKLRAATNPLSLDELKAAMPTGTQILQYAVLEDRLIIWVVNSSGIHHQEVAVGSQLLTEKVRTYLKAVNAPPTGEATNHTEGAKDLYRLLVARAEPFLDKSKFLCIVPDKILHYLPYRALVSPATARYLMEDYDIGIAPSSTLFAELSAAAERRAGVFEEKMLGVGNPQFDQIAFSPLRDLPSAARETQAVAEFYPRRRILVREEAGEATIRSEIAGADVAHLAMHYVINERSEMLSGFPLASEHLRSTGHADSDGFLQSYEIYMMNLPRTRLVVLSACQTGIEQQYRGEGAVGVARPFMVVGVPIVVASLWPVDSDASAQLMVNFHKHRIRTALPVTKALSRAQIEMAYGSDIRYRHPYYWAAFLAIGAHARF